MDVTARATRSGKWWAVEVPEIDGLYTQARRLDGIPDMVRDAAELLGVEVGEIAVVPVIPEADQQALADVRTHLAELEELQKRVAAESRRVAAHLHEAGLSVRDVGALMQVTPQRVSQLIAS